ncbi:MAG: formate dehydrogenase-N subunit alpha [Chloroflexi bacterium]|nr:formate dehydrogenase-N subunit alpha [Chloroflexota bacterium]
MTNDWVDLKNSDVIFIIGANPASNHPASFTWITNAREQGAKLIVVDPAYTRSAAVADVYAPIRPGTDIVFLGGLMNYALQNRLYNAEYVKAYTNALTLINPNYRDAADLDGLFSGYNADTKAYATTTWQYQTDKISAKVKDAAGNETTKQVSVPKQAASLDEPNTVFSILKQHYARYTPEMVERVCGTPKDKFLDTARSFCATGAPDKAGTILYAMGQTQHTVGTQNVRSMAMLQLLLGNIGVIGGGVNALRGESNVQGSTDMALLFGDLPGYLGAPTDKHIDLQTYAAKFDSTSYWINGPRFIVNLLKAWYGDAAKADNNYAYDYLPKTSGNYSWISLFEAMSAGKLKGLLCMGQNPAVSGPNARMERQALNNLDWLVVMDLFETETASFWKAPGVDAKTIHTEVFLLPAVDAMEKSGTIVTSGRRIQWRYKVANGPGEARSDIWILDRLTKALKAVYQGSTDQKDRPILDLNWFYGEDFEPDVELVVREINGYALDAVKDATGRVILDKGALLPAFATIASAANYDAIACGNWIFAGYFAPADDGRGIWRPAARRRGQKDPGNLGLYPYWGFTWPANRHILYNRASAKPDGTPWSENKKLIWWDAEKKTWIGYDVPDFAATKAPDAKADPAGLGLATQSGTDPFIMKADGKGWLFAPSGLAEGPLPEHYEPIESPVQNALSSCQCNPVVKVWTTNKDETIGDRVGAFDQFPIVCTTFRLGEHWQAGAMSRSLPWLAELQPDLFVLIGPDLAAARGIANGDKVKLRSARGEIEVVAMVSARMRALAVDGKPVHIVRIPWHWGWQGIATGDVVNDLTPHVGDGNTMIPEYKAFLVDVKKA